MIQIPLYSFLFVYFIFLAVFAVFYFIILYHIVADSSFTLASFFVSFFIFAATILTLYAVWFLLSDINWRQTVLTINFDYFTTL